METRLELWADGRRAGFAAPPPPALDRLLIGRPVAEALDLLPRLFNLCAAAQSAALRLALDAPPGPGDPGAEVLRDHLALLALRWPRALGLTPLALPRGWASDPAAVRRMLLGAGDLPSAEGLDGWLAGGQGAAPVMAAIAAAFAPGEAESRLPPVTAATVFGAAPVENSPAARQADHPLLRAVVARWGRGPLWQAMGRLVEALACLEGRLPPALRPEPGLGVAPASRGLCAVAARAEGGRIAGFARRTPTDHLLAPGGGLDRALATLCRPTPGRVRLLVEILDPCLPHVLREAAHA